MNGRSLALLWLLVVTTWIAWQCGPHNYSRAAGGRYLLYLLPLAAAALAWSQP